MSNEVIFTADGLPHQSSRLHLKESSIQGTVDFSFILSGSQAERRLSGPGKMLP